MLDYLLYRTVIQPGMNRELHGQGRGPVIKYGDDILAGPYPQSFADFVGQEQGIVQILTAITSAGKRRKPLSHMLLACGHPGVGKTTLARLTAHVLGGGFLELGGQVSDKDAIAAIKVMQDGDVLFLDEIHRLVSRTKANAEWLLTLLQDGTIQTPSGTVQAPRITVIAATTDAQRLPNTILHRFPLRPTLEAYSASEAVKIARVTAKRLGFGDVVPLPEGQAWLEGVATATDRNPRRMSMLLGSVLDIALATDNANLLEDGYDLATALRFQGLTEDGLTREMQDYLVALTIYGGLASAGTIKSLLGEGVVVQTESALINRGYLEITGQGRRLTDHGLARGQALLVEQTAQLEATA